jgi:hypothetical protein
MLIRNINNDCLINLIDYMPLIRTSTEYVIQILHKLKVISYVKNKQPFYIHGVIDFVVLCMNKYSNNELIYTSCIPHLISY